MQRKADSKKVIESYRKMVCMMQQKRGTKYENAKRALGTFAPFICL